MSVRVRRPLTRWLGVPTAGAPWRKARVTCTPSSELASHLAGQCAVVGPQHGPLVQAETQANLDVLQSRLSPGRSLQACPVRQGEGLPLQGMVGHPGPRAPGRGPGAGVYRRALALIRRRSGKASRATGVRKRALPSARDRGRSLYKPARALQPSWKTVCSAPDAPVTAQASLKTREPVDRHVPSADRGRCPSKL